MDFDPSRFNQDEHEKYFFGFNSTEVYDTFRDSIVQCIADFLKHFRNSVVEENEGINEELIEHQIEDVRVVYLSACLEVLSKYKTILRDIFSIPPNAPIYGKREGIYYSEEQVECLREEVEELERLYLREKMFLEILELEKKTIDRLKPVFLETGIRLSSLKSKEASKRKEKLEKLIKTHETCMNNLVLGTIKIGNTNELQIDFG